MPERVLITDVAPRDGLQNEPGVASTQDKIRLITALAEAGVNEIEAASFVSPRWVPQLADASDVLPGAISATEKCENTPLLSALIPNRKGFERAAPFHSKDRPLKISVFTAASETFNRRNTNASIAESVARFAEFIPEALALEMPVRMYISCAIACPFEGPISPDAVRETANRLIDIAPDDYECGRVEIDLADTIGVATPEEVDRLLGVFDEKERSRAVLHLHDTYGRAVACVRAALQRGVRSFDGSAAGLGGCPFAGDDNSRAPGNLATELLVQTVEECGFETSVNRQRLQRAASIAQEIVDGLRHGATA